MTWSRRTSRVRQYKFLLLLVSLLLLAVLDPIVEGRYVGQGVFNALFCLVLAAAIFAVSQKKRPFLFALILGIPALSATWGAYFAGHTPAAIGQFLIVARFFTHLAFLIFAAAVVLYDVLQGEEVTVDRLYGAACVYLLLGVIWTSLYSLIEYCQPGSFAVAHLDGPLELRGGSGYEGFSVLGYYSFVTLSTLGYGDVTPVSAPARTFAWLEAVFGQLYLAVLIARVVGLHIAHAHRDERNSRP